MPFREELKYWVVGTALFAIFSWDFYQTAKYIAFNIESSETIRDKKLILDRKLPPLPNKHEEHNYVEEKLDGIVRAFGFDPGYMEFYNRSQSGSSTDPCSIYFAIETEEELAIIEYDGPVISRLHHPIYRNSHFKTTLSKKYGGTFNCPTLLRMATEADAREGEEVHVRTLNDVIQKVEFEDGNTYIVE
jgi:hypothetical protein